MPSATRQDQLVLVPWDPNSPEHVNRIYEQRVQCGWDKHLVEGWKERQVSGQKSIFWIVGFLKSIHNSQVLTLTRHCDQMTPKLAKHFNYT